MGEFVKIKKKKEKETSAQSTVASGKTGSFVQIGDTSAIGKMEGASFGPKAETKTETKKASIVKPGSQQKRSTNPTALSRETDTGTGGKKTRTGAELISDTRQKYGSYTTKKQMQGQLNSAARITGGLTSLGTGVVDQPLKAYQSAVQEESRRRKKVAQEKVQKAENQIVQVTGGMGVGSVGAVQTTPYQQKVQRYKQAVAEETGFDREMYILEKSSLGQEQDTFTGQFSANFNVGRLTQDESLAWNDYLNDPTPENRAYAEAIGELLGEYVDKNGGVLDEEGQIAPWLSKSLANYLPQFFDQTKAQVQGGLLGGAAGFAVGTAVPGIGNAVGLTRGVKAGVVAASGKYSYDTMRGAAFKSLLDLGLSEEQARDAANDEALISSMIEMGDTATDILTLGGGKLLNMATKGGSKAVVGKLAKNETTKGLMKVLGWVGTRYGLNILGEGLEEETQEAVSMANENRVLDGTTGSGKAALAKSAWDIYWDYLTTGLTDEQKQRIQEAGDEGRRIAVMLGGATLAVNETVSHSVMSQQGKAFRSGIANGVQTSEDAAFETGRVLGGEAGELAEKLQSKWTSGKKVSDAEMGRLLQANEQELRALTDRAMKTDDENVTKLLVLAAGDRAETGAVRAETLSALKAQVEIAEKGAVTEQEKVQVVQQANPDATVVSTTTARIMEAQGVSLKTAQVRADIIQRLMDGEQLDVKEINKIDPTNAKTKALFTELTGVQFPAEKVPNEQLYAIYRSAAQVQQEQAAQVAAQLQEAEATQPVQAETAVETPAAETPAQENSFDLGGETIPYAKGTQDRARQVMAEAMGEVGGDGKPLETITQFKEAYRSRFPKATDNEVALKYQEYLKDAGTIDLGIEGIPRMRRDEFLRQAGEISGSGKATERELRYLYEEIQQANREGYTGVEKLSLSEEERESSRKARQKGKSVEQAVREARETTRRRELESAGKRIQAVLSKGYGIKEVKVVYDAEGFLAKANASIENGVLTFNGDKVDSAWAMYWTLGHELTHPAAATDSTLTPDILSTFRSLEQGGYFKDSHGDIDAHREALSQLYRPVWEQQKTEQDFDAYVDEELAADLMRTALQHQRTLDRLAGRTPTILEEAQAKVNRLLSGFRQGKDIRSLAQAKSALETLSGRLEKALKAAERQREKDAATRYSVSEDGRVLTTPTGVEVIQNPTDAEYRQLRDEALQEMPWLRGTGEPMLRHTYDEQGNEYYWRADRALHADVEPYINKQYKTRTSQQWRWWESPYKDEYPATYDLSKFSLDETRDVDRLDLNPHNETGNLTEDEVAAVLAYKSSESYKINAKLREGLPLTGAEQQMVSSLDQALEKLPKVRGTVYRTLNFDAVFDPEGEFERFMRLHMAGGFTHYEAYTSTSTVTDGYPLVEGVQHGVTFEISSVNARDLSGFGNNSESEALFPRDTDFIIRSVRVDESGHMHIVMEEAVADVKRDEPNDDPQKFSRPVRDLQEAHTVHSDVRGLPGGDSAAYQEGRKLPGVRGENQGLNSAEEVREDADNHSAGSQDESVRTGRVAGQASGPVRSGPVDTDRRGALAKGRNPGREDLGVSDGRGLKSDPKPHLFARALSAAIKDNPNGEMVDFHDSMELSKMKRFMSENGGYGVAVESDGNITAVFNNYAVSGKKGVVKNLLLTALENGGTKLDCYATYAPNDLTSKYAKLGFIPVAWMRFNPEYAKEGWHHGEPDVVFFVHNGDSAEMVWENYDTYPAYTKEDIRKLPEFTDYDEAKAYQESKVQEITKPGERYSFSEVRDMPFADQVELVAQNKFNEFAAPGVNRQSQNLTADSNLYVMEEPTDFMRELGYGDYAVVVTQQHIRQMLGRREDRNGKVINEHNHQLTQEQVSRLPELLQSPAMVLEAKGRPESLIFVTTETDYKGRPIIIPVKANGLDAAFDGATGPAHLVTSMYGRDNFAAFLQDAANKGEIIYYNEKRADPIVAGCGLHRSARLPGIDSNTIVGAVQPIVKDPGERKFSFTPEFSENFVKWYKEQYGESDLTEAQLKRAMQRAEARALRAEESRQAEATLRKQELQDKDTAWQIYATAQQRNDRRSARERVKAVQAAAKQDRRDQQAIHAVELAVARDEKVKALRDQDTAWQIEHTRQMREQAAESRAKLADAKRLAQREKENAVRETREIERAEAAAQHDADRMNERRRAAARLHRSETTWQQKTTELREKGKLNRKAARDALHESAAASEKRASEVADQAVVSTIRQDPKAMREVRTLQSEASKLHTLGRSFYRNFVNQAEAIDRLAQKQPDGIRASTLVTTLGASSTTVERIYKDGLVARDGSRIGASMRETFLCLDEKGKTVDENKQALLQDYLLHRHNQDRMDLEGRALRKLEAFETENPWLAEMPREEFARLVAMTEAEQEKQGKKDAHDRAVQYAGLLKEFTESQNKPIFADSKGNAVTAETSRIIADQYLAENPWLEEKAQSIYTWWDQFMQEWAVGDSISQAEYERMRETYPHYVPTYRAQKNGVGAANFVGAGGANVSKAVKKAKGSFLEVMRVEDSFSNLVSKIVRLERTNELYKNLIDTAIVDPDSVADMIRVDWDTVDQQAQQQFGLDDVQAAAENAETTGIQKTKDGYKLTAWYGGHQVSAYVNEELYRSIAGVTGNLANDLERNLLRAGNALTSPMKTMITGINPFFAVRNVTRDFPTAVINSISGLGFWRYYAQAATEMMKRSDNWEIYKSLGGTHAGYYNDNQGFAQAMSKKEGFGAKAVGVMGTINEVTEAQTRFAEYLATIDRLGDTYENRLLGIKNSAEVTVDFSRKGRYGKVINAWVPYWNPAVQGIDKVVRSVIEAPDVKSRWIKASKTLGRAALLTVSAEIIQYAVLNALDRDDDWEQLSDRTKDTYYCIPIEKSHTFIKIPKNREWGAVLGTPVMRLLEARDGRENPFENYLETSVIPNFLPPVLPVGVSQYVDIKTNKDFADRDIVPYAYQEGSKSEQWDSDTSYLARVIGSKLVTGKYSLSPMQIDYIISDYYGDLGEVLMGLADGGVDKVFQGLKSAGLNVDSLYAWRGDLSEKTYLADAADTLVGSFVADSRYSNQTVSDYYETLDQLSRTVQDRKNQLGTDAAQETKEYQTQKALNSLYGKQISDLNTQVRGMADGEEKDALKAQIAELAGEALTFYQDCMDGKITNPQLTADYADLSPAVSDELIRLNALSEEYKFKPTGNPSSKYTDPKNSRREYILTGDDEAKAKYKEIYQQVYNELTEELMGRERYRKAKDSRKAELLEANREKVLDETRDQFLDWLAENRRSEKKRK